MNAASVHKKEIIPAIDIAAEIARLKKQRNAIILAHYYQEAAIQDIADYVGDSLLFKG